MAKSNKTETTELNELPVSVKTESTVKHADLVSPTPEEEMGANVSVEQLSFICEYCGKVNSISSPSCVRCGKRRPRSAYVEAMAKVQNAETIKARYIEEEAKLNADRKELAAQQLARLVETRVADEKVRMEAQTAVQLEKDRDDIKRNAARDAVLRIIAAENVAEEKIKLADEKARLAFEQAKKADETATQRIKSTQDLATERILEAQNVASKKIKELQDDSEKRVKTAQDIASQRILEAQSIASQRIKESQEDSEKRVKTAQDIANQRVLEAQNIASQRIWDAQNIASQKIKESQDDSAQRVKNAQDIANQKVKDAQDIAVQRILEAQQIASKKIKEAEDRAEDIKIGKDRETAERIASERERVLYAAAKRLISERAGIESAAEERIDAQRREIEKNAETTITESIDQAKKEYARKATLKIIAAEEASKDQVKLERDAITRAAFESIDEARRDAESRAQAKYIVERKALEQAFDDRIKAERARIQARIDEIDALQKIKEPQQDEYRPYPQAPYCQPYNYVQPLTIVPYVNAQQPLYQKTQKKVLYKFVPDVPSEEQQQICTQDFVANDNNTDIVVGDKTNVKENKKGKCKCKGQVAVRVLSVIVAILGILTMLACIIPGYIGVEGLDFLNVCPADKNIDNIDMVIAVAGSVDNAYVPIMNENAILGYIAPAGMLLMLACACVGTIIGICGLFIGRAKAGFGVFGGLQLLGAIVLGIGLYLVKILDVTADGFDFMSLIGIGIFVLLGIINTVLSSVSVVVTKKAKKCVCQVAE